MKDSVLRKRGVKLSFASNALTTHCHKHHGNFWSNHRKIEPLHICGELVRANST